MDENAEKVEFSNTRWHPHKKNLTFIKVIRKKFQRLMRYQFEKGTMLFVRDLIYFHTGIAACFNKGLKHALHLSIYEHFHMKSRLWISHLQSFFDLKLQRALLLLLSGDYLKERLIRLIPIFSFWRNINRLMGKPVILVKPEIKPTIALSLDFFHFIHEI